MEEMHCSFQINIASNINVSNLLLHPLDRHEISLYLKIQHETRSKNLTHNHFVTCGNHIHTLHTLLLYPQQLSLGCPMMFSSNPVATIRFQKQGSHWQDCGFGGLKQISRAWLICIHIVTTLPVRKTIVSKYLFNCVKFCLGL